MEESIIITDHVIKKVIKLISEEEQPDLKLRIFVQGGGCSGFQYGFTFEEMMNEDDFTIDKTLDSNKVSFLVDPISYQYLQGAIIDYVEDLDGSQFVIKNPNAKTTCGCGSSFSV